MNLKRDIVLLTAAIEALLGVFVVFNLPGLSQNQSAAAMALVMALSALIQAGFSTETSLALVLGVARAGILLAAAYGWNVSEAQIEQLVTLVAAVAGMFIRFQGSPLAKASFSKDQHELAA